MTDRKGLILCDAHATKFRMRDVAAAPLPSPSEVGVNFPIYVTFAPSSEPVPDDASCDAILGDSGREHDGALAVYTLQRSEGPRFP